MFKSPRQRLAFFHALKQKMDGTQNHQVPMAMPLANPQSPPSMAMQPGSDQAMKGIPANPAAVRPANPLNFLKLRKTLKPKF